MPGFQSPGTKYVMSLSDLSILFFVIQPSGFKEFLETTPCARNSLLYGVAGGMATGVGTFMFTSMYV